MTRHVIEQVRFRGHPGPSGTAPMECSCKWRGTVDGFRDHRRAVGMKTGIGEPRQ